MSALEVLSAGTLTTVQDWPGRTGYWEVGVPPSGPMDDRSFRIGNRLVGNLEGAPGLEVTLTGPRLRFDSAAVVAVTGAPLAVELDGTPVEQWAPLEVPAGGVLRLGAIRGAGMRAYVLVGGGLGAEPEMGSCATFAHARLGGRPLRKGDRVMLAGLDRDFGPPPVVVTPAFTNRWALRVVLGPHGAPDFLTSDGLRELLEATWTVHHHSDRTGVRLIGPAPEWAREDGGEAGLHPSNILDSAYGVGTVMLAGDMAVVVGPDGPSLGGFIALAQVTADDLWRVGQLRAGDEVTLRAVAPARPAAVTPVRRTVFEAPSDGANGPMTFRRAGERGLLVEFGEPVLDVRSRVRVHALREALEREELAGVLDITPGVRSLHVHRDPDLISERVLLDALVRLEASLPAPESMTVTARTVHLPLAWRHSQAMLAVARYATSVRADAPWCPDNIEFIRRINGLEDEAAVQRVVLDASYLVLGLGDVYMGAPVAVPIDPRHRLVTTKYNPARTWTPANAVGIGGAFLCVYGMEGPGGYQLIGRTVPIWHPPDDPPWRLRHFDQLRFHAVGEEELEDLRADSDAGRWAPRLQPAEFSLAEHERFCAAHAEDIAVFRARREEAFAAERGAWGMAAAMVEDATWS